MDWKVILLKNHNVVVRECIAPKWRAVLIGLVWKYVPDLTFDNRDFLIVDAPRQPEKNEK
jgi:hypothetical protein